MNQADAGQDAGQRRAKGSDSLLRSLLLRAGGDCALDDGSMASQQSGHRRAQYLRVSAFCLVCHLQQGIRDTAHGGDNHHRLPLEMALDDSRDLQKTGCITNRCSPKLHDELGCISVDETEPLYPLVW